jgi:hypothetical protein
MSKYIVIEARFFFRELWKSQIFKEDLYKFLIEDSVNGYVKIDNVFSYFQNLNHHYRSGNAAFYRIANDILYLDNVEIGNLLKTIEKTRELFGELAKEAAIVSDAIASLKIEGTIGQLDFIQKSLDRLRNFKKPESLEHIEREYYPDKADGE